jgi:hypothetical protein
VDTSVWDKFHRWQVINTVLQAGLLIVIQEDDGTLILRANRDAELKSSVVEPASSDSMQKEVPV